MPRVHSRKEFLVNGEMKRIRLPFFDSFFQKNRKLTVWSEQKIKKKNVDDTLNYIKCNQKELLEEALLALINHYSEWRNDYGYNEDELLEYMPIVSSMTDFSMIIKPTTIVIHSNPEDHHIVFGLIFDCTWDDHGVGFLFDKCKVIKIGQSDSAI